MQKKVFGTGFEGLNGSQIKLIAIIAMTIDHIAWAFGTSGGIFNIYQPVGQISHIIGRLTAPIMCFFIAEGYRYTRSLPKYIMRLIIIGVPSEYFRRLALHSSLTAAQNVNIFFTLALGLVAIAAYDRIKNIPLKVICIAAVYWLSQYCDWSYFAISFCLVFYIFARSVPLTVTGVTVIGAASFLKQYLQWARLKIPVKTILYNSGFQFAVVLSLPVLLLYNGKRGGSNIMRWGFYFYYPLHLLILGLLRHYVF